MKLKAGLSWLLLGLYSFFLLPFTTYAAETEEEADSSKWYVPDWVEDLGDSLKNVIETFQDLMSGELIYDAIVGFVVKICDEMVAPLYGAFAESFLFTPQLAEIDSIYRIWSIVSIIGLILLFVGIAVLTFQVIRGKKSMGGLLKVFLVCFFATLFSLTILNFLNVGGNWLTSYTLETMLRTEDIDYQGLTGEEVLKALVVGSDALTDPSYAAMTLGELTVQTEGGIFVLLLVILFIVLPLFLVAVFKSLILMLLVVFVGYWITTSAYTGKMEKMIGFGNIYIRTLLVGYFCALYWGGFVRSQTDYGTGEGLAASIGIPPIIFSVVCVFAFLIALFFFWIKPVWQALTEPATLGGGRTVERMGKWGERMSGVLNMAGKRLGVEPWQTKGLSWAEKSRRMADVGRKMQEASKGKGTLVTRLASAVTGGASEALQGVTYEAPSMNLQSSGDVIRTEQPVVAVTGEQQIEADAETIRQHLTPKGFRQSAVLQLPPDERRDMFEITNELITKHGNDAVEWRPDTGQLLIMDNVESVVRDLQQRHFTTNNLQHGLAKDGVFVDLVDRNVTRMFDFGGAEKATEELKKSLPVYSKLGLPQKEAAEVHERLKTKLGHLPWVQAMTLRDHALWIPEANVLEATALISQMKLTPTKQIRYDMPRGSAFLDNMLEHWKKDGHDQLLLAVTPKLKENCVYVREEQQESFKQAFDTYTKNRTPYWRTLMGNYKVIKDGVPVDVGRHAPLNGLDMGTFEQLQNDMLRKRQEGRDKS